MILGKDNFMADELKHGISTRIVGMTMKATQVHFSNSLDENDDTGDLYL